MTAELRTSVDIDAPPERVWAVLTDLPAYAEWNPFVTEAAGAVVEGGRLSVRVPPVNAFVRSDLRPTVRQVVPLRRLRVWSRLDRLGVPGLFSVEHTVTLTDHGGGVRLWQQDRFGGLLAPLLVRSLNQHRLAAFHAMVAALKRRAEATGPALSPGR
ncbi:SRPBCC family protein [Geodermatophilus sp. SYSU D01036]